MLASSQFAAMMFSRVRNPRDVNDSAAAAHAQSFHGSEFACDVIFMFTMRLSCPVTNSKYAGAFKAAVLCYISYC